MCRLLLYKGKAPIQLAHLLTKPEHSIINQSFDCRLRVDRRRPLNGDGFGVGWYEHDPDPDIDRTPCIFTSVTPAWSNINLTRLAEKIKSHLVFAHVRASTGGAVSETNCHPWNYGRFMWMHNGGIVQFEKIKRLLTNSLSDEFFNIVQGNTDSEWAFALFLNQLEGDAKMDTFDHVAIKKAMLKTIELLNAWSKEAGITEPALLNFAVTDGESVVCTRYITSKTEEAASLYFSSGTRFESCKPGHYRMIKADRREDIVVVASEPLTFEKADWLTIPNNTVLVITPSLNVLLYPVRDQYYNPDLRRTVEQPPPAAGAAPYLDQKPPNDSVGSVFTADATKKDAYGAQTEEAKKADLTPSCEPRLSVVADRGGEETLAKNGMATKPNGATRKPASVTETVGFREDVGCTGRGVYRVGAVGGNGGASVGVIGAVPMQKRNGVKAGIGVAGGRAASTLKVG